MEAGVRAPRRQVGRRTGLVDKIVGGFGIAVVGLAVLVMAAPVVVTTLVSFSGDEYFTFPPDSWGWRQYNDLFSDPEWGEALGLSFRVSITVALISAFVVVPTVFAIYRSKLPGRNLLHLAGLTGIIIPASAFAIALYGVFTQLGLRGTFIGLVLANCTLAVPVMMLTVAAAMSRLPVETELAAMVAGASRRRAWLEVTARLLVPTILAGGLLAFITSFDEAVLVNFLAGPGQVTLPKAILDSARFGVSPVVTAIATLLMAGTSVLMLVAMWLVRRGR